MFHSSSFESWMKILNNLSKSDLLQKEIIKLEIMNQDHCQLFCGDELQLCIDDVHACGVLYVPMCHLCTLLHRGIRYLIL